MAPAPRLAAILGYTELLFKNAGDDVTRRQLEVVLAPLGEIARSDARRAT